MGDEQALIALGKKVLEYDFCYSDKLHCEHRLELHEIELSLASEPPPDCPHCGKLIADH